MQEATLGIASVPVSKIPAILDMAKALEPKLVPCFVGDAGVGKTPHVHAWATQNGAACHVQNFGHMQPQDISMAMFAVDGGSYGYVPMDWLLAVNRDAADKTKYPGGAVLFLDECNRAPIELVNALFTLTDDRRVHQFTLHPDVLVVAAMNPSSSGHNVNRLERDPAMRKRLAFIHVVEDLAGWLTYATHCGMHPLLLDFLRAQGDATFYNRGLRDQGKVFPNPSAWDKAARVFAADADSLERGGLSAEAHALLSGVLGTTTAEGLRAFVAERFFVPEKVFSASLSDMARLRTVLERSANDPRVLAFRTASAQWVRTAAIDLARGAHQFEVTPSAVSQRVHEYLLLLSSEQVQAWLIDLRTSIEDATSSELTAPTQWEMFSAFATISSLDAFIAGRSAAA